MKKTLFLSAILATALCSSAFGALNVNVAEGGSQTLAGQTINGGTSTITSAGTLTITGNLKFTNGATATFTATGEAVQSTVNNNFCLQLGNSNTAFVSLLASEGNTATYNMQLSNIAVFRDARLTVGKDVTLKVNRFYYNSTNVDQNGEVNLSDGATVSVNGTADSLFHDLILNGSSSLTSKGNILTSQISMSGSSSLDVTGKTLKIYGQGTANNVTAGTINFGNWATQLALTGTNTVSSMVDLSMSPDSDKTFAGKLLLKEGATLTNNGTLWMRSESDGILLEENAKYIQGKVTVTGKPLTLGGQTNNGQIVMTSGSATYGMGNTGIAIRNATVDIADSVDTDMKNQLEHVALNYSNSATNKTLKLYGTNTLTDLTMGNGATLNIAANDTTVSGTAQLNGMMIAANSALTLSGSTTISGTSLTNNGAMTLGDVTLSTGSGILTQSGSGTLTINGVITTAEGMTGGNHNYALILNAGKLEFGNGANAKETDIRGFNIGGKSGSSILVKNGYSLTTKGVIYTSTDINNNSTVEIESGASLSTVSNIYAAALTNEGSLTAAYLQTKSLNLLGGNATISGDVDVVNKDSAVGSLTLSNGADITAETIRGKHNGTITTTALTVTDAGSEMNANLVIRDNGTLTFADNAVLTMGCDVTIGNDVTVVLTDTMVESIMAGNDVEIIAGVDKAYLSQSLTFIGSGTKSGYVAEHEAEYSLKQVGDKIYITPEPATATLSLLALAGLCARRRRH